MADWVVPMRWAEPELTQFALEVFGVGLVEQGSKLGQAIDVEPDSGLVLLAQVEVPLDGFGLELDLTYDIATMLYLISLGRQRRSFVGLGLGAGSWRL